jgi:two-component system phosphate regulon response regulator PhoB
MSTPLIVIINDDAALATMLADLLTTAGYQTQWCQRGSAAYGLIQHAQPDLVLLDIQMEQLDTGWRVLDTIRSDPTLHTLPVLICSTYAENVVKAQARGDPWCAAWPIPFAPVRFLALIQHFLARERSGPSGIAPEG